MAWFYGEYTCGHEGRTNVVGPTKNRQYIADRNFAKMCPDCYEKHIAEEREKANIEAEKKAAEMELPILSGSEKQITWANTIRQDAINKLETSVIYYSKEDNFFKISQERGKSKFFGAKEYSTLEFLQWILKNKTTAKFYIDNRFDFTDAFVEFLSDTPEKKEEKKLEKEIKQESTVTPEKFITNVPAEINFTSEKITVKFEKNDTFRKIVKSLGYSWDGIWSKNITKTTGSAEERAAELGNKLLNAGFPITICDKNVLENAVAGKFESECKNWIFIRKSGKHEGRLAITWEGYSDTLYSKAKTLPGAVWDSGMVVRIEHYLEVEDFAELNGFKFSSGALEAIEEQKKKELNKVIVKPEKAENKKEKKVEDILNSKDDVIDDLKD